MQPQCHQPATIPEAADESCKLQQQQLMLQKLLYKAFTLAAPPNGACVVEGVPETPAASDNAAIATAAATFKTLVVSHQLTLRPGRCRWLIEVRQMQPPRSKHLPILEASRGLHSNCD